MKWQIIIVIIIIITITDYSASLHYILTLSTKNMINSHPTVIGIASDRRNFLRPKVRDNPPAGRAPKRAPIRYMDTTHDDCSMVCIINIFSPAVSGCSGAVQPPTTVPEANDITEAFDNNKKKTSLKHR